MIKYLLNLLTKAGKILATITFFSLLSALSLLIITVNKNYGLDAFIKSEDFTAYYTSSKMIISGEGNNLYNLDKQLSFQNNLNTVGKVNNIFRPFINPPYVALLFIPLSFFSLNNAYFVWVFINLILLIYIFKIIFSEFKQKPKLRETIPLVLLMVSFPPVIITLISGQISLFLILAFLLTRKEYLRGNKLKAGIWLSFLFLKPQYLFLPLVFFIYKRQVKLIAAFLTIGIFLSFISYITVGGPGLSEYLSFIQSIIGWEDAHTVLPSFAFSLRGFLQLVFQNNNLWAIFSYWLMSVVLICFLIFYSWTKMQKNTQLKFDTDWSMIILGSILITPYISGQDASILIIPAMLIYFWSKKITSEIRRNLIFIFLVSGYVIFAVSGFFTIFLHFQIQVLYLCLSVLFLIWTKQIYVKDKIFPNK